MTRAETARILIAYGFSAFKAWEIALDHERGERYADKVVHIVLAARRD